MAIYENLQKNSPLTAVEFTPVSDGNFSFFYIDSPVKRNAIREWLTSPGIGQEIMAETSINGRPVLVTHGDKTQEDIMRLLEEQGDKLVLSKQKQTIDAWKIRSSMSVAGQSLQMLSAWRQLRPDAQGNLARQGIDGPTMLFAVLNMTANIIGYVFGSQKTEDKNQLSYLKEQFNHKLDSHVADGSELPKANERRSALHLEPEREKTAGEKFQGFLQRNSVTVGEIGLRYAAALALTFPLKTLRPALNKMMAGEIREAIQIGRNPDKLKFYAGAGYLLGKTMGLFSKVKDPYDNKPHTALDTVREEVLFKADSVIEAMCGTAIALNGFKQKIDIGGKPVTDYAGGVGGLLFAAGYAVRLFAKFGEKQMNMDELQAHISDSLAKVPPEELPQLIAECAATLKEHFKDKPLEFGQVYTQIMTDMYRYHHIALDNLGTQPEERIAKMNGHYQEHMAEEQGHTGKHPPRNRASELAAVTPASSHAEKAAAAKNVGDPHVSLGA